MPKKTKISGSLKASGAQFGDIDLLSNDSSLRNSTADNIVFKHQSGRASAQILRLSQGTVINGDVTFEDGNGIVYMDSTSRITGKVKGAINGTINRDERLAQEDQMTSNPTAIVNGGNVSITGDTQGTYIYTKGGGVVENINIRGDVHIGSPPILLIAALLIGTIASFAFGGPLWLGITLAVITAICIGAKLADKFWSNSSSQNARVEQNTGRQPTTHTPSQTVRSHQPSPNVGPANQAQNTRTESPPNNPQSSVSGRRPPNN